MATHTPTPIVCKFLEINKGKHRTVRHYEPTIGKTEKGIFSNLINLSNNRAFAKSMPQYWVKCKEGKKWSSPITGLFTTNVENIYKGDINHKTNLLLMRFSEDGSTIIAYLYLNYFTRDISALLAKIK